MALHILPLLFAKVAAKIGGKKAIAHRGLWRVLAGKVAQDGTEKAIDMAIDRGGDKLKRRED